MSITEAKVPNEILIRYAEDGTIAGAHVSFLETVLRDGVELSRKMVGPYPMGSVEFPTDVILNRALTDALITIEALNAEKAVLEKQLAEGPEAPGGEIVPGEVTMRQARLALHAAGLLPNVRSVIDMLTEPDRTHAAIEWETAKKVERTSPIVLMLARELGIDEPQLDLLFEVASAL